MNEYKKTHYAINKYHKGIAYKNEDGSILEVTFEKIAKDNPEFTAKDFEKLKVLSDELYHDEAKNDYTYYYHNATPLNENLSDEDTTTDLSGNRVIRKVEDRIFTENLIVEIDKKLTPTQKRRLTMFIFGEMTTREIADADGVTQRAVWDSIEASRKRLKKFFKNF